jgi:hypothetical protein
MALTQVDQGLLGTYAQYTGFKNRIINGGMVINQRAFSATITTNQYTLDRWQATSPTDSGKFSVSQSSTAPTGFSYSLLATSLTAYTVLTNDRFSINQAIEGYNIADLAWGTASASTITLSFWVRSSLTGTFGGSLTNNNGDRSYPFTFTISSANTFEYKTITITGPTTGTWGSTNGTGVLLFFGLGVGATYSGTAGTWANADYRSATGATSLIATNGATMYITGVQFEKGSTATSFDYRPYTTELSLCQRYLPAFTAQSGTVGPLPGIATALTTSAQFIFTHPVPARVPGTGVGYSAATHFTFSNNDGNTASTAVNFGAGSPSATQVTITIASSRGGTTVPGWIYANNASAILYITGCEL